MRFLISFKYEVKIINNNQKYNRLTEFFSNWLQMKKVRSLIILYTRKNLILLKQHDVGALISNLHTGLKKRRPHWLLMLAHGAVLEVL